MTFSTFKGLAAVSFFLSCGGCGLWFWGHGEEKLNQRATAEPVSVELARLEAGDPVDNFHVVLGPHLACYSATIYSYKQKKRVDSDPTATTKVEYCIYPIVSTQHPQVAPILELLKKNNGQLPEDVELPPFENFAVLVKTERFKKFGDIPETREEASVRGLVINEVQSLSTEEKKLIHESFPKADLKKVWILQEGRTPSSATTSTAAIYGGIALGVLGVVGGIVFTLMFFAGLLFGKS